MNDYVYIKITPKDIREKLKKWFPEVKEMKEKNLLIVPKYLLEDFQKKHKYIRDIKKFQDKQRKKVTTDYDVFYELSFYRGEFDVDINAYKIETVIPKILFDLARKERLVFAVRFKSVLLEDKPEGVLFWYINEKVSL